VWRIRRQLGAGAGAAAGIVERRGSGPREARDAARDRAPREDREVLDAGGELRGERGRMVPNQYWVPECSRDDGDGKYFQYHGDNFVPPRELGGCTSPSWS